MSAYPVEAVITAKEKRYQPVKHYVFIVQVKWSDGSKIPIYRHYSDFAQLHTALTEVVACILDKEGIKYMLPVFPVKKAFQRSEVSKTATQRGSAFDEYCQGILKTDKKISQHKTVIDFFKSRYDDINPQDTIRQSPSSKKTSLFQALSLLLPGGKKTTAVQRLNISHSHSRSSDTLDSIEEDPIYVSSPIVAETYIVLAEYTPLDKSEIKLKEGMTVEVVEKYDNGWWFVQTEYGYGWAPATYLTPQEPGEEEPEPIYSGHRYMSTEDYTAELEDEVTFTKGVLVKVLHKLLDGWWIIDYQGTVGYAPATYLTPLKNPHYRDSKYGLTRGGRPTKRRTTIRNARGGTLKAKKQRDLSIYKKLSEKLNQHEARAIANRMEKSKGRASEYKKSVRVTLPQDTEGKKKESENNDKTNIGSDVTRDDRLPSHDYDYIDDEDMEEINEWVNTNIPSRRRASEPPNLPDRFLTMDTNKQSATRVSCEVKSNTVSEGIRFKETPVVPKGMTYNKPPSPPNNKAPDGMTFTKAPVPPGGMTFNKPPSPPGAKISQMPPAAPGMIYAKPPSSLYSSVNKLSGNQDTVSANMTPAAPGMVYAKPPSSLYSSVNQLAHDKDTVSGDMTPAAPGMIYAKPPTSVYYNTQKKVLTNVAGNNNDTSFESPNTKQRNQQSEDTKINMIMSNTDTEEAQVSIAEGATASATQTDTDLTEYSNVTKEQVLELLIQSLRSKSIHSVRHNEQGEFVISFDSTDQNESFI